MSKEIPQPTIDPNGKLQLLNGYTLLSRGIVRHVRVNGDVMRGGPGKPFIVMDADGEETEYSEVKILGPSHLAIGKKELPGCVGMYTVMSAWIETEAALAVKS